MYLSLGKHEDAGIYKLITENGSLTQRKPLLPSPICVYMKEKFVNVPDVKSIL
jgi:hypothetical protein